MPVTPVAVTIDGERWRHWEQLELRRSIDSFATVSFTGPFDPERPEMRRALRPFGFQGLTVDFDGSRMLTGSMLTPQPRTEADARTVQANGYALPAVMMDAHADVANFPIEWKGADLAQIARQVAGWYGLELQVDGSVGPAFDEVKLEATQPGGPFLAELARQRGRVLRDTPDGALLITTSSRPGRPVAQLVEGEAPLLSAEPSFNGQDYFSAITGLVKSKPGRRGGKHSVENPHISGVVRPLNFLAEDCDRGDLPNVVNAKLARMFGNMVAWVAKVPTWRDESGNLWEPDTTVSLKAPGSMVYDHYEFLIREVTFAQGGDSESAALGLVLPGAFSGEAPRSLPWD